MKMKLDLQRSFAFVCLMSGSLACAGCADAPMPAAVARQSAPPKPAAPPPGDKDETPIALAPATAPAASNPAAVPVTTSAGPASAPAIASNPVPLAPTGAPATAPNGAALPPNVAPNGAAMPPNIAPANAVPAPPNNAIPPGPPGLVVPGATPSPANVTVVPAAPGVGVAGKGYGNGDAGFITTPISAYFNVREQLTFDQIAKAMQLYRAIHYGFPKTQEEFDKEIIKANSITLPELPKGHRYQYDPKTGELTVVQPKG